MISRAAAISILPPAACRNCVSRAMILEESGLVGIRECTRCGLTINWLSIREKMETLRRHDWIIDDFGRSDVAVRCLRCGASGHAYMDAGWIDMYPCG